MSRVVPEGTTMLLRTMVEHDFLLADAEAASVKVQDVARSSSLAGVVGVGAGTATARVTLAAKNKLNLPKVNMVAEKEDGIRPRERNVIVSSATDTVRNEGEGATERSSIESSESPMIYFDKMWEKSYQNSSYY